MKTHENRALFSKALLKATTCLFLTAGAGMSPVFALPEASTSVMETVQQNQTISGRITDTSGEPVIGASVVVKGTTNGTITDFDGKFSLNAPAQGTLTISYIGYKKMEISINGQRTVNVTLKEDTEILDEVVVVGYGTQKKATLTGSVSSVSGEDIKKVSAANLSNTLAGKTAGIIANTRSGEPGEDGADILIRGKGTLIPVQRVPVERINRVTRKNHQGVIAFISSVTYQKTEDLVPFLFEQGKNPLFVMLDGITDVRNFGAIARTCECAAVDAVIIPARNSVSVNADAMKTSAGALHTLPVCREHSLKETLQFLKNSGFHIVAATEKGDYDYTKADYTGPMCIIMGAEDKGVSYDNLALCDEWVKIPMLGTIESLNVSVAAGILIYEAVKQRTN